MERKRKAFRWAGGICLGAAAALLVLGLTILRTSLETRQYAFLYYWAFCFVFTLGAMLFAMLDFASVKSSWRNQQQKLIEETLVVSEEAARRRRAGTENN